MNIVDCLAIAPYYITLFFMPPPNIDLGKLAHHIITEREYNNVSKMWHLWIFKTKLMRS